MTRAGPRLFVKSVGWHRRAQGYTVYNFEVEPLNAKGSGGGSSAGDKGGGGKFTHSYFVGSADGGAWVHNGKYDDLLNETVNGARNITSRFSVNSDEALEVAEKFLGGGYREIGLPGSGVFRSGDGLRQFRMDVNSLAGSHAPNVSHIHMELYGPNARFPYVNNHMPLAD